MSLTMSLVRLLPSTLCLFLLFVCYTTTIEIVEGSSAAGQETLVGIVGKDFVMIGADSSVSQSIALTASNLDKISVVVDPALGSGGTTLHQQTIVAAAAGDAADSDRLLGLLSAHAAIREYEAGVGCDVHFVDCSKNTDPNDSPRRKSDRRSSDVQISPPGLTVEAVANLARAQIASSLRSRSPLGVCLLVAGMLPVQATLPPQQMSDIHTSANEDNDDDTTVVVQPSSFSARLQRQVQEASKPYRVATRDGTVEPPVTVSPYVSNNDDMDRTESAVCSSSPFRRLEPRLYWLDSYGSCQKLQYGAHGLGANFCLSILDQGFRDNMSRDEAANLIRDCFQQLRLRYVINSPQPPCIKCVDASGCRRIVALPSEQ